MAIDPRDPPRGVRRPRGLTLVELAIGMAVVGILAAIAMPNLGERLARQRLATAAETLALDLAEARFEAARSGQALHVVFDRRTDWCYAVARTPGCGCATPASCQVKVVHAADAPGVTLAEAEDAHFDPAGVSAAGGQVLMRGGGDTHRLQVGLSALGRPKVCSPTAMRGYPAC